MAIGYQELPDHLTESAITVLTNALMIEPGYVHLFPDEGERALVLRITMAAILDTATRKGKTWAAIENNRVLGAGVWLAPGNFPLDEDEENRSKQFFAQLDHLDREKLDLLAEYDANSLAYFPTTPSWYLQILGVDPSTQGRGVGSNLMRFMLEHIGDDPCYLETATPLNLGFYEKLGFHIHHDEAQLTPDDGPTHWTLFRPGR